MWICLHNSFALWFCGWISSADIQYLPGIDKENLAQSACSSNWSAGRPRKIFCNTVPYHTWGCSSEGYLFHFFLFRYFFGIPVFLLFLLFCYFLLLRFFFNLLLLFFFVFLLFQLFILICFSASLLFLLLSFLLLCFFRGLLSFSCTFLCFLLLRLSTSTCSFSAVMRFCCSTSSCSFVSLLPFFTVSLLSFSFPLFSPVCILNETLL